MTCKRNLSVVLLFEGSLLFRVSEEQGEIFTLLSEILVGGVTLSIPNGAEFAAFTSFAVCLTFVWFPSANRVKRSVSIVSIVCFPSIVRFVWNVWSLSFVSFGTFSCYCSFHFESLIRFV